MVQLTVISIRRCLATVALMLLCALPRAAYSQCAPQSSPQFSAPGNVFGRFAVQWNAYFGAKVDANNGTLCSPNLTGSPMLNGVPLTLPSPGGIFGGDALNALAPGQTYYIGVTANQIETLAQMPVPTGRTLRYLYVQAGVAPGTGKSFTATLRQNAGNTKLTCTITGAQTSCADSTDTAVINSGDLIDLQVVSLDTGTAVSTFQWAVATPNGNGTGPAPPAPGGSVTTAGGVAGQVPLWLGPTTLGAGLPYGTTGASVLVQTLPSGLMSTSVLPTFTSTTSGIVPPSGGGTVNYLRADGSWATPPGGTINTGSANQATFYAGTGTAVSGTPALLLAPSAVPAAIGGTRALATVQGTANNPAGNMGFYAALTDSSSYTANQNSYAIASLENFAPTVAPTATNFTPEAMLADTWYNGTVSWTNGGGKEAAVFGLTGQVYVWPSIAGSGLTLSYGVGGLFAAQLGFGAGTGEGTLTWAVPVIADIEDSDYGGDATTKGTIGNIAGVYITPAPCSNGRNCGTGTPNEYGIFFGPDLQTPGTGYAPPNGGSIASVAGEDITIKPGIGAKVSLPNTTPSTSPCTGALVVGCTGSSPNGGGLAVGGAIIASGGPTTTRYEFSTPIGANGQPLFDFIDNASNDSGAGFDVRFFSNDSSNGLQEASVINGGLSDNTAGAYFGDIDFIAYKTGTVTGVCLSLNAKLAGWIPCTTNVYSLGVASQAFSNVYSQQLTSTVATGTAPLAVSSTTVVPNLNAQYVNGQAAAAPTQWTPSDASGASLSLTVTATNCVYTQFGKTVTLQGIITYPSTVDASGATIGGLPVVTRNASADYPIGIATTGAATYDIMASHNFANIYFTTSAGVVVTNATLSGLTLHFTINYLTN